MLDINLFIEQPKVKFYSKLFDDLDLILIPENIAKTGCPPTSKHALFRSFIIMKLERIYKTTELLDFLANNRIIAYFAGFSPFKKLPSYSVFSRFLRTFDNKILDEILNNQVKNLHELKVLDTKLISLDATPLLANTKHNNPKSFTKNKFCKDKPPKSDKDCKLGVHTASNEHNEKKFTFFWGYKVHALVDSVSGLALSTMVTTANVADSAMVKEILNKTNSITSVENCKFIGDKGYDTKEIHNFVVDQFSGECFIPINQRGSKNYDKSKPILCEANLLMHKDGKTYTKSRVQQKYSCQFKYVNGKKCCPIKHEKFKNLLNKNTRGCTKQIELPHKSNENRLKQDRNSVSFKKTYSKRTEVERYNSRLKELLGERLWVRNLQSVTNIVAIANIAMLAVAHSAHLQGKHWLKNFIKTYQWVV